MFTQRTLALVVSSCLLVGCAVGPDYHQPDAPLAERYQAQSAVQQRNASRPASFAVWWDDFGDSSVKSVCYRRPRAKSRSRAGHRPHGTAPRRTEHGHRCVVTVGEHQRAGRTRLSVGRNPAGSGSQRDAGL